MVLTLSVLAGMCGSSLGSGAVDQPAPPAAPATTVLSVDPKATFLISDKRIQEDSEIFWPGFLTGLRGFEQFYNPVGNPIYFESPLNNTGVRFLYLHHNFDDNSTLRGGDLDVIAAQARVAITERLGFIATKDGHSDFHSGALPHASGWNDIAAGLKYVVYVDRDADYVATVGARYQMGNGNPKVLQGGVQELSPFVSFAKGWEKFHLIGNLTDRVPLSTDDGNNVLQWDVHADYEVCKGVAPMIELHGLHYLSNGTRTPLPIGGADYTNLGSNNVSGSTIIWLGVGGRIKLTPQISVGATYEHPLTNPKADIFGSRVTVDLELTW
ncbi:MAG: hypothetical protein AABZ53_17015 [Planctomycetota bacterium]